MQNCIKKFCPRISFASLKHYLFCCLEQRESRKRGRKITTPLLPPHPQVVQIYRHRSLSQCKPTGCLFLLLCHLPGCSSQHKSLLRHVQRAVIASSAINQGLSEPPLPWGVVLPTQAFANSKEQGASYGWVGGWGGQIYCKRKSKTRKLPKGKTESTSTYRKRLEGGDGGGGCRGLSPRRQLKPPSSEGLCVRGEGLWWAQGGVAG